MKSFIEQLKETVDRPLESFLDNADEAFTEQKEQEAVGDIIKPQELESDGLIEIEK